MSESIRVLGWWDLFNKRRSMDGVALFPLVLLHDKPAMEH